MKNNHFKKGFSLIELSIVIIIIGLLIGVLIAARSIRNTAQVQAVISDFGKYKQAAVQYKEKYYYWPGDDPGAGSVWQDIANSAAIGDGNGQIGNTTNCTYTGCITSGEITLANEELILAGFITANYGPTEGFLQAPIDMVSGGNLPKPVYYYIYQTLQAASKNTINVTDFIQTNGFVFGGATIGQNIDVEVDPVGAIKPSDALAIDIKIDDGAPNTGYVRGLDNIPGGKHGLHPFVSTCTVSGNGIAYDVANDNNGSKCISSFSME